MASSKVKTIPALEVRTQLGRIMKDVHGGRIRVLVEKSGVPMVGIISAEGFPQKSLPNARRASKWSIESGRGFPGFRMQKSRTTCDGRAER